MNQCSFWLRAPECLVTALPNITTGEAWLGSGGIFGGIHLLSVAGKFSLVGRGVSGTRDLFCRSSQRCSWKLLCPDANSVVLLSSYGRGATGPPYVLEPGRA